jgi:hypothetical protein
MFTLDDMRSLIRARPFVPFRVYVSDGGSVEVPTPEVVLPGKRFAVVGHLDPDTSDIAIDRYTTIWYLHVTRHEMLDAGAPPSFGTPPGPTESPSPTH